MSNLLVVVDRLEGKFAIVEFPDRSSKDIPLDQLPDDVKDGDCFWFEHDKYIPAPEETDEHDKYIPAPEETEIRKAKISKAHRIKPTQERLSTRNCSSTHPTGLVAVESGLVYFENMDSSVPC